MSHGYRAVSWTAHKRAYDLIAGSLAALLMVIVAAGTAWRLPDATVETLVLRSTAVTAFVLLHVILSIGPLCRLDRRLLPLLYNRRHLGVLMAVIAMTHGGLALIQFHAGGDAPVLVSVFQTSLVMADGFPFQFAGLLGLGIIVVMAATSHDFWLRTLTAPVWKAIHMGVYLAYALLVVHVSFGVLQSEVPPWSGALVAVGCAWIAGLHTVAARHEAAADRASAADSPEWVDCGPVARIPDGRARVVCAAGERIAVFRYGDRVSALSNVCQHQNGPLGEGKIVGGCVVCPWHGYEYRPESGASPPPFTEAVPTFVTAIRDGHVWVDPRPLRPGTRVEPARVP
jgi:nitrite reductase/ring-hydroxylating ferredoxin subunit/DMSO/TMAO reductase YedYZ heme-binding membrane subunit